MGVSSEETQMLLPPKVVVASQTVAVAVEDGVTGERKWDGSCAQVCGRCDATGLSSCAFAYLLPCVAFGINSKRALLGNAWLHGFLYVFFFLIWRTAVNAASWNMYIQCGVFEDMQPPAGDHYTPVDGHRKMLGPKPHSHDDQSPECQASIVMLVAAQLMMVLFIIIGIVYAARRRTLLRQKLGIAGCWCKDLALWCCCGLCALSQETRTLATYNVEGGVWHGPTRFAAPMAAPSPKEATKA